jgi:hypothetical protein
MRAFPRSVKKNLPARRFFGSHSKLKMFDFAFWLGSRHRCLAHCIHVYVLCKGAQLALGQIDTCVGIRVYAISVYVMSEDTNTKETVIISTRADAELQQEIDREAKLRDHTRSQALEQIIRLGLPRYLKRFPKKFERVNDAVA